MKKWILLSVMLGALSLPGVAQDDDMYFVPTKSNVEKAKATYGIPTDTYYSGSSRSVDEYNRFGSSYEVLPADTGDIISFAPVEGVYPDSLDDFALTRQMARWDDYEPSAAYWSGYSQGLSDSWGWHSPWYFSSYSYYPWYDRYWYDPWYWDYGWYGGYGWYSPWYSWRWGGWGYYSSWYYRPWHYYGWGGGYAHAHYNPGTQHHGRVSGYGPRGLADGRSHTYSSGSFGSGRSVGSFGSGSRGTYGGSRNATRTRTNSGTGTYSNSHGNFGGSRSGGGYTPGRSSGGSSGGGSYGGTRSSGGGSSSGGSFGGSRSGGGSSGGGGRSGGGGFGSGRR